MKKKVLSLCLVIALVAIAAISTTLAYFTDTDAAKNVFTVGGVKIDMHEEERVLDADGNYTTELKDFTQDQVTMPAIIPNPTTRMELPVNDYTINIRDNVENYIDKIISVENTGKSDAYVRTIIAIPAFDEASAASAAATPNSPASNEPLHWNGVSNTDTTPNNGWIWGKDDANEWPDDADMNMFQATIDGRLYDVYVVTNINVLAAGDSTGPCFAGFYLDDDVDCEVLDDGSYNYFITIAGKKYDLGDISSLEIYAFTQATQAQGFDNAWVALDSAFGAVTAEKVVAWAAELA